MDTVQGAGSKAIESWNVSDFHNPIIMQLPFNAGNEMGGVVILDTHILFLYSAFHSV